MATEGAVVVYGRGAGLGNFKFFADDLVTTELAGFAKADIHIQNIERRDDFFSLLLKPPFKFKIKELHIYSHSIGGGLFLGYHDPILAAERSALFSSARGGAATYFTVLAGEKGTIFTDHFQLLGYLLVRSTLRACFASDAKIKIWGCNAGVEGWLYSDDTAGGGTVSDLNAPALHYYWRALNEYSMPKPSIAQAFADYFKVKTYGAQSGSSIEVQHKGKWMRLPDFQKTTGRRSVGEPDILRLGPTKGTYVEYTPG